MDALRKLLPLLLLTFAVACGEDPVSVSGERWTEAHTRSAVQAMFPGALLASDLFARRVDCSEVGSVHIIYGGKFWPDCPGVCIYWTSCSDGTWQINGQGRVNLRTKMVTGSANFVAPGQTRRCDFWIAARANSARVCGVSALVSSSLVPKLRELAPPG